MSKLPQISSKDPQNCSQFSHKSLSILKKARKQAEEDAQLLANRIALLKQEELKTLKKIEETKAKALEIYRLKLKNEQKTKKTPQNSQKPAALSQKSPGNSQKPKDLTEKIDKKQQFLRGKLDRIAKIKQEKRVFAKKRALNAQIFEKRVFEKKTRISEEKALGRAKIREFYEKKREKFKEMQENEMVFEEKRKGFKEREIQQMEKLEIDLILKLQASQEFQRNAYEELEQALTLPAKQWEKLYFIKESESLKREVAEESKENWENAEKKQENGQEESGNSKKTQENSGKIVNNSNKSEELINKPEELVKKPDEFIKKPIENSNELNDLLNKPTENPKEIAENKKETA